VHGYATSAGWVSAALGVVVALVMVGLAGRGFPTHSPSGSASTRLDHDGREHQPREGASR
jgi:hypothetical protein